MEGCREWGLKSLYCQHLDDLIGYEGDYRFMKALELEEGRDPARDVARIYYGVSGRGIAGMGINPRGTESESDGDDAHGDSGGNGGESGEDSDSDSHHQRSEDRRRQGREAFRQIGRLVRLEALCLDCDEYDDPECQYNLTLERGWLGELAGLKELKRLRMGADFWSRMGQTEVEFMHAQWPKLEMITFQTHLEQFLTSPHWQWLQERRPNLRYTSGSVQ
ncbi:hypothetical protein BGX34_005389 [Mortierella sp. NVP85]|nr:hypothetical protein BGX34_005389 [Mortierella sp. NVP85]